MPLFCSDALLEALNEIIYRTLERHKSLILALSSSKLTGHVSNTQLFRKSHKKQLEAEHYQVVK
jgi:hypothetical protein